MTAAFSGWVDYFRSDGKDKGGCEGGDGWWGKIPGLYKQIRRFEQTWWDPLGATEHGFEDIVFFQGGPEAQTDFQTLGGFTVRVYCAALCLLCSYTLFLSTCHHPLPPGYWLDGSLAWHSSALGISLFIDYGFRNESLRFTFAVQTPSFPFFFIAAIQHNISIQDSIKHSVNLSMC